MEDLELSESLLTQVLALRAPWSQVGRQAEAQRWTKAGVRGLDWSLSGVMTNASLPEDDLGGSREKQNKAWGLGVALHFQIPSCFYLYDLSA